MLKLAGNINISGFSSDIIPLKSRTLDPEQSAYKIT